MSSEIIRTSLSRLRAVFIGAYHRDQSPGYHLKVVGLGPNLQGLLSYESKKWPYVVIIQELPVAITMDVPLSLDSFAVILIRFHCYCKM